MEEKILNNTRVLFRIGESAQYLMTNDKGDELELLRIFSADSNGKIYMEGYLLGSVFAHNPYIIPKLKKIDCTFGELNSAYFDRNLIEDGLLGLAVGDAFGVPFEFLSREQVRAIHPADMVGNDRKMNFKSRWSDLIPAGAWSDDTSMTLAAMASIINHKGDVDYEDVMKQFLAWWEKGKYASIEFPFGLGRNISKALQRYASGIPALNCGGTEIKDNGNGALMRMFPFSMYCIVNQYDDQETLAFIRKAAVITHGHEINVMSCFIYTVFLRECVRTLNPQYAYMITLKRLNIKKYYGRFFSEEAIEAHKIFLENDFELDFNPDQIPESGYVVDSLAVCIYSILNTNCYEDAIKKAVNFGYDTDTYAAITGSIAGILYGKNQIPEKWINAIKKKEELLKTSEAFSKCIVRKS